MYTVTTGACALVLILLLEPQADDIANSSPILVCVYMSDDGC